MGRVVMNDAGAARRPGGRVWMVWTVLGCTLAYVIGYAIVKRFMGGQ